MLTFEFKPGNIYRGKGENSYIKVLSRETGGLLDTITITGDEFGDDPVEVNVCKGDTDAGTCEFFVFKSLGFKYKALPANSIARAEYRGLREGNGKDTAWFQRYSRMTAKELECLPEDQLDEAVEYYWTLFDVANADEYDKEAVTNVQDMIHLAREIEDQCYTFKNWNDMQHEVLEKLVSKYNGGNKLDENVRDLYTEEFSALSGGITLADLVGKKVYEAVLKEHPDYEVDEIFFDNGEIQCHTQSDGARITLNISDYIFKIQVSSADLSPRI